MAVRDPKTEQIRIDIYKQMTPQQRIEIASQLYRVGIANMRSAILDRNPQLSELEIEREMRRRILPRRLFREVEAYIEELRQKKAANDS